MDRTISWGVLAACAGLAACGGGGNEITAVVGPTAGKLDSALPFGVTNGIPVNMLSADLTNGDRNDLATITFNNDGSYSITLPGAGGTVTVDDTAVITDGPLPNGQLGTTSTTFNIGDYIVDAHLGEDDSGNDLFILARVEPFDPADLAYMVFGEETTPAALPTGGADVVYTGGFVSDVINASGGFVPNPQLSGTTAITANFGTNTVGLEFTVVGDGAGIVFTGTSTSMTGAQYSGNIASTGANIFTGTFSGAFYGPNAEGTAGVFNAEDLGAAGTADDLEIIGGYTGRQ